ncbi:NUDIX domain-containing protein [Ktedonosporobacter rubrisoli]|uniref:NUDIX domain-containing protein n=1 Tax=Ktedonosporobacter rubrisoli TaxID=2509675 RepID=A0A4P6K0L2_KTERU|nr:NUDIX domain-containing protein [Ktedonosporobacter rubrisoli]QBD80936.1 NUDIX domain-containing protein [Ktedonosporobacter rubrisoli]
MSNASIKRPLVGVGVIVKKGEQILLMQRQNSHGHGTWSPPGGHLEYGETVEECATREAFEETGVKIANPVVSTITNDIFAAEEKHYITIWVESTYAAGEPCVNSAREVAAVGWFSWDALPEPLFLPLRNLLAGNCAPAWNGGRLREDKAGLL